MEEKIYDAGAEFDDISEEYDDNLRELVGQFGDDIEKYAEYKVQLVKSLVSTKGVPKRILDFGCGTGRSLQYLRTYFPEAFLYGCDVSPDSLNIAKKNSPHTVFFLNDLSSALYAQNVKWDLVFLACVMHHIEPSDRKQWLKAIGDNIAPGGYLVIFEHNLLNPMTKRIVQSPLNRVDRIEWMLSPEKLASYGTNAHSKLRLWWQGYTLFFPWRFPCTA